MAQSLYGPVIKNLKTTNWAEDIPSLDQGQEGECVGYGWTDYLACAPFNKSVNDMTAEEIYALAQKINGQVPDEQSGTSVVAGAEAVQKMNLIKSFYTLKTATQIQQALQTGPVVIGIPWFNSMFSPNPTTGMLTVDKSQYAGGHCVNLRALDVSKMTVTLRNSWGASWGLSGDALLRISDLGWLMSQGGTAIVGK